MKPAGRYLNFLMSRVAFADFDGRDFKGLRLRQSERGREHQSEKLVHLRASVARYRIAMVATLLLTVPSAVTTCRVTASPTDAPAGITILI
jgi:hypothetical protein